MNIGRKNGLADNHERITKRIKTIETDFGTIEINLKPNVDTRLTN